MNQDDSIYYYTIFSIIIPNGTSKGQPIVGLIKDIEEAKNLNNDRSHDVVKKIKRYCFISIESG